MKKFFTNFIFLFLPIVTVAQINFYSQRNYLTGGTATYAVVAADFDGDGDQDFAAVDNTAADGFSSVNVFKNSCGLFHWFSTSRLSLNPQTGGIAITAGNFDGDTDIDLAVANNTTNNVSILTNNGIGVFAIANTYAVGTNPRGIMAANLNGDGDLDLAVSCTGTSNIYILTGAAGSTFNAATAVATQASGCSITAADLDGDGDNDLITTHRNAPTAVNAVVIYTNNPVGTFTAGGALSTGAASDPMYATAANLNGAGQLDIVIGFGTGAGTSIKTMMNDPTTSANNIIMQAATAVSPAAGNAPLCVAPADYDLDGDIDLVTCNYGSGFIVFYLNNGAGTFSAAVPANQSLGISNPRWIVSADFDGDGKPDVAVPSQGGSLVAVVLSTALTEKLNMVYDFASNSGPNYGSTLITTFDCGYIISGQSGLGPVGSGGAGGNQVPALLKINKNGTRVWAKAYGSSATAVNSTLGCCGMSGTPLGATRNAPYITRTQDGNYIMAGRYSQGGSLEWGPAGGSSEIWVLKLNTNGDTIWTKSYGAGAGTDFILYASCIEQVVTNTGADNGYIILGYNGPGTFDDMEILKISSTGTLQWSKRLDAGGTGNIVGRRVIPFDDNSDADTYPDDGFLIVGYARNGGNRDVFLVKYDASGNLQWQKCYGDAGDDEGYAVVQMPENLGGANDHGFLVAGYCTNCGGAGKPTILLFKVLPDGSVSGGSTNNTTQVTGANAIATDIFPVDDLPTGENPDDQLGDNGYIVSGIASVGIAIGGGRDNALLYKVSSTTYNKIFLDTIAVWKSPYSAERVFSVKQSHEYGYVAAGYSNGSSNPANTADDFYFIKTDGLSMTNLCSSPNNNPTTTNGVYTPTATDMAFTETNNFASFTTYGTKPKTYTSTDPVGANTCDPVILPIELLSFTANCNPWKKEIVLKWSTASETNNNYFTIERSSDGNIFEPIGTVNGAGNSSTSRNYKFLDSELPTAAATIYYRLKQTDYDGKSEIFNLISVRCSKKGNGIYIFPNPFSTQTTLSVRTPSEQTDKIFKDATLTVYNSQGQQVKQIKNISGQTVTFNRDNLASGLYFIRLTQDGKTFSVDKLVIVD